MPDPRFHIEAALAEGARLRLDAADSRHADQVLRLKSGAGVRVFNARDGEWRANIETKDKRGVALVVKALLRAPMPAPDIELLFAPVKRDATDLIVEKATELGVRRIVPVITARAITDTVRVERLAAISRSAAAQTERFDIPEILEPRPLAKALDQWPADRPLIYADEAGDDEAAPWGGKAGRAPPILDTLESLSPRPAAASLLIGPEGGFDPTERRMLRALRFVVPVSLGPRILRAETAAIAALAIVQSVLGDWARR